MGVFTRFRDIINSNINAMLDRAEDPEKLIKLMIREMEDTLVELKSSCAQTMASRKKLERRLEETRAQVKLWEERAQLAVSKGRDDLAREALSEKRRHAERVEALERDVADYDALVEQYRDDIAQLEEKLRKACEKRRILVERHVHAQRKMRAQEEIRRAEGPEAVLRFEEMENRIERMEMEADLVNAHRKRPLDEEFDKLAVDEDIEEELARLKSGLDKGAQSPHNG